MLTRVVFPAPKKYELIYIPLNEITHLKIWYFDVRCIRRFYRGKNLNYVLTTQELKVSFIPPLDKGDEKHPDHLVAQ